MVWIAALAVCAAASLLVETAAGNHLVLLAGTAVPVVAGLVLLLRWLGGEAGWWSAVVASLRPLTGVGAASEVVPGCATWAQGGARALQIVLLVLLLAVALVTVVPAVAGVLGVPAGAALASVGGLVAVARRDADPLQYGLRVLTGALACLVLAALVLRGLHAGYTAVMC